MDHLPSWNDGQAKSAIEKFVRAATDPGGPGFVPEDERIATFDQDGTMWVEHPTVTQLSFALARIFALAPKNPKWKETEPFASILARDEAAIAKFTMQDLEAIVMATHAGMATGDLMQYLRANGFKVYIVTGGGQAFVRTFAQQVYGIPPERVIGSAGKTSYSYTEEGRAVLMKQPAFLFFDDTAAKAEDIYLFLGRRPHAAFGNSDGDRQMLEYTHGNSGATLAMLVLHDDAEREYAYGPANGLPDVKLSPFSQTTFDEATAKGWPVISMKNDWKRIFAFEP